MIIKSTSLIGEKSLNSAIIYYAEQGDRRKVEEYLAKGADVNANYLVMTPLIKAIVHGHEDVALFLLTHPDIDVNLFNDMHEHALILSLIYKREKVTTKLLERDDVNWRLCGYRSGTGLTYTIFSDQEKFAHQLIDKELQTYYQLDSSCHPEAFNWAIRKSSFQLVRRFLDNGIDPNQQDDTRGQDRPDWVWKIPLKGDYPIFDHEDNRNDLPLLCAFKAEYYKAKAENIEIIELLLSAGADPDKQNSIHETARDFANQNQLRDVLALINTPSKITLLGSQKDELVISSSGFFNFSVESIEADLSEGLKPVVFK